MPASTWPLARPASEPRKSVTKPPRLADQQQPGGDVPEFQILFPEAVVAAGGDPGEVERGGAEAPDPGHLRRHGAEDLFEAVVIAVALVGNAGRDQRLVQVAARRDAQPPVLRQAPRPFSAQKLSSVSGW